jgi:hypothetical protein
MSVQGQKATSRSCLRKSASPLEADIAHYEYRPSAQRPDRRPSFFCHQHAIGSYQDDSLGAAVRSRLLTQG